MRLVKGVDMSDKQEKLNELVRLRDELAQEFAIAPDSKKYLSGAWKWSGKQCPIHTVREVTDGTASPIEFLVAEKFDEELLINGWYLSMVPKDIATLCMMMAIHKVAEEIRDENE